MDCNITNTKFLCSSILKVDVGESKFCFCCEEFLPAKCTEKENALKLYPVQSCNAVHLLLKVWSAPNIGFIKGSNLNVFINA